MLESLNRLPLMAGGPGGDAFRPHWLVVALQALVRPAGSGRIRLETEALPLVLRWDGAGVEVAVAPVREEPDGGPPSGAGDGAPDGVGGAVLRAPGAVVLAVAAGFLPREAALASGASYEGDRDLFATALTPRADGARPADSAAVTDLSGIGSTLSELP